MNTGQPALVVDLEGLTFADKAGLTELVRAWRRAEMEGRRLTLRAPSRAVRKVLGLTRIDRLMVVEEASTVVSRVSEARSGPLHPAQPEEI